MPARRPPQRRPETFFPPLLRKERRENIVHDMFQSQGRRAKPALTWLRCGWTAAARCARERGSIKDRGPGSWFELLAIGGIIRRSDQRFRRSTHSKWRTGRSV